jgi:hypothetical protein
VIAIPAVGTIPMAELETISHQGRVHKLLEPIFWHVSSGSGGIYHNAFLAKGFLPSMSLTNQMPGLEDAVSPYSFRARFDEKEQLWERVRKEINEALPSRVGAFFLVESESRAKEIADRWFAGEQRNIVKARVIAGSVLFRADARWLDSRRENWEAKARRYWAGDVSELPMWEILAHGAVYFPDWQKPPFGLFAGILPIS